MARFYSKENKLILASHIFDYAIGFVLLAGVTTIILFVVFRKVGAVTDSLYIVSFLVIIGALYVYANSSHEHDDPESRDERENANNRYDILYELRKLSDTFLIFNNCRSATDMPSIVVVGPTGVFVLETSCRKKILYLTDQKTEKHKTSHNIQSIMSVKQRANSVRSMLEEIDLAVTSVVVNSDHNSKVEAKFMLINGIFIIDKKFLLDFLATRENNRTVDETTISIIENKLMRLI